MKNARTDLAVEIKELHKLTEDDGFIEEEVTLKGISISRVKVVAEKAEKILGKPKGTYITVDFNGAFSDDETHTNAVDITAQEISSLLYKKDEAQDKNKGVLVIGLGNAHLTSDAIGPKTVENLVVTRHLKEHVPELFKSLELKETSALAPGVLGQTGIETAEIVRAAIEKVKPEAVIIIDALASRRLSRLCSTIQISNTGITPGSGVGNNREEISEKTVGVPVISIGIPTVVDAATLTADTISIALEKLKEQCDKEDEDEIIKILNSFNNNDGSEIIRKSLSPYDLNLIVTPKDIDALMQKSSKLLGLALNKALHGGLSQEEINMLLSN
jgi:spore protease